MSLKVDVLAILEGALDEKKRRGQAYVNEQAAIAALKDLFDRTNGYLRLTEEILAHGDGNPVSGGLLQQRINEREYMTAALAAVTPAARQETQP